MRRRLGNWYYGQLFTSCVNPRATLAALVCFLAVSGPGHAEYNLTLLYTSDIHAHFDARAEDERLCIDDSQAIDGCSGGMARLAAAISQIRATHDNVLLVDAGDMARGTDYYSFYRGSLAAELMNAIGYDAMAPGNHEFDMGLDGIVQFAREITFPLVAANVDISAAPELDNELFSSIAMSKNGQMIGIVGVTIPDMYERSEPGSALAFSEPVLAVQQEVDKLTGQGINIVILVSHLGYYPDRRLAQRLKDVDIIVGGHSHVLLSNTAADALGPSPDFVNGTGILQAGGFAEYLGFLDVKFDERGQIIETNGSPIPLTGQIAEDEFVAARLSDARREIAQLRLARRAETVGLIDGSREACWVAECAAGNLIADALLDHQRYRGAEIALYHSGAINASIDLGDVTFDQVKALLRYGYAMSRFQATGEQIIAALEYGVSSYPGTSSDFLQVSGIRFEFDPSAPAGERLNSVEVVENGDYVPLLEQKTYLVVSNTTLRQGRGGFNFFKDVPYAYDHSLFIWDIVMDYLSKNSPYMPVRENRIRLTD